MQMILQNFMSNNTNLIAIQWFEIYGYFWILVSNNRRPKLKPIRSTINFLIENFVKK